MEIPSVTLNGIVYRRPSRPVVVVCIDGGDPAYLDQGLKDGIIPNIRRFMETGFSAIAQGTVPSFTCPNNMSITTGTRPSVHGISGNFFLDRDTGEAVVMTGPELLRSHTIMAEFSRAGARAVSITAKDKLRKQLGKGMRLDGGSMNFSSQYADRCTMEENGIENVLEFVGRPLPDMYSADLSLFVLDAGLKILEHHRPDIMYLSLTDYVQHKCAPGEKESNQFYMDMDERFGRLADLGAIVALTADHGMNDKSNPDGSPKVIWLQDVLDEELSPGAATVICPITDQFTGHHGSLGGFVRVYCHGSVTPETVMQIARQLPGVDSVHTREGAALLFDLPVDREGDVAVLADGGTCIGASESDHDLSGLKGARLRTHGGVPESRVPFILSEPLNDAYAARADDGVLGSHQIFDYVLNGTIL